jgi:hypothetical protein
MKTFVTSTKIFLTFILSLLLHREYRGGGGGGGGGEKGKKELG